VVVARRLSIFLGCTFVLTASAWGSLLFLLHRERVVFGQPLFMLLYATGGFAPTVAAYVAVLSANCKASLAEFHRRLFRVRLPGRWHITAVCLPVALTLTAATLRMAVRSADFRPFLAKPWFLLIPYFFLMILGGGLEELGWRGVAQPELERWFRRPIAALIVGALWSVWHLPLFAMPGVSQYGRNFPVFAVGILGDAMILAWLYARTESIALCVMFHASGNAVWTVAFGDQPQRIRTAALASAAIRLIVGIVLAQSGQSRSTRTSGS
jgi:membrane protease YdiL (CAAX protease family)